MTPADRHRAFPNDDALCERCGYPLKGIAADADCPECGQGVALSSPATRTWPNADKRLRLTGYPAIACSVLLAPRRHFRMMRIDGDPRHALCFLLLCALIAAFISLFALNAAWLVTDPRLIVQSNLYNDYKFCLLVLLIILAMTTIEMIGVTAFSRRRGWRVPFSLAQRVCCYASVGWLPGVVIACVGASLLDIHAAGRPWFEQLLGLVRVGWLLYAALFVLALLWFETLVWIGVRQVCYANAWPRRQATGPDLPTSPAPQAGS